MDYNNLPSVAGFSFIADIAQPFPSRVCSSLFLSRCNLRCPFCINRDLVVGEEGKSVDVRELLMRLAVRQETFVVVSGGEPFLHPNVGNLFRAIQKAGMRVAVATNGTFPERMIEAGNEGLVNHIILDVKARPDVENYSKAVGRDLTQEDLDKILRSVEYLKDGPLYRPSSEFRTTVCSKFVSKEDLSSIADLIGENAIYVLQPFTTHQTLDPSVALEEYAVPYEKLQLWAKELEKKVFACFVREV